MIQIFFRFWATCFVVVAFFCIASTAQTQKDCNGIEGCLTTIEGWVIAGAAIRAVNNTTKQAVEVTTESNGEYVACLAPGTYDVVATMLGFKPAKRKSVKVETKTRHIIDFTLKRGKPIIIDGAHP